MKKEIFKYYEQYDEEGRLKRDNSHKIEFLTSMYYFKKMFKENSFILDACAGTGNYAFSLARLGYKVIAGDIVPKNVELMKEKQTETPLLKNIYLGDVTHLNNFKDQMFDNVLCMGAFYHAGDNEKNLAMRECLRVLKPGGLLVISYINKIAASICGLSEELDNIDEIIRGYDAKTRDNVFLFMSSSEMEQMANKYNTKIAAHIAADGISYLLNDKINNATDYNFNKWMELHLQTCEDKALLGYSLHGLIFLQKL